MSPRFISKTYAALAALALLLLSAVPSASAGEATVGCGSTRGIDQIKFMCFYKHDQCAHVFWNIFMSMNDGSVVKACDCGQGVYDWLTRPGANKAVSAAWHYSLSDINWAGAPLVECYHASKYYKNFWSIDEAKALLDPYTCPKPC